MSDKGFSELAESELAEMVNILAKKPWVKEELRKIRERKKQRYQTLLDNCVDDDKAILYKRELEEVEEAESDGR